MSFLFNLFPSRGWEVLQLKFLEWKSWVWTNVVPDELSLRSFLQFPASILGKYGLHCVRKTPSEEPSSTYSPLQIIVPNKYHRSILLGSYIVYIYLNTLYTNNYETWQKIIPLILHIFLQLILTHEYICPC